jgi:predicted NBD/HSP70 family sugar kinase
LDLLSRMSDRAIVGELAGNGQLTRAALAARTGLSKPTVSEGIRRLFTDSVVEEAGRQSGGRGRAGTYYRLRRTAGCALAVHAGPDGVVAETIDLSGVVVDRRVRSVGSHTRAGRLGRALREVVRGAIAGAPGPVSTVALSIADPVDQVTGRLVQLRDSPFLTGELAPADLLRDDIGAARLLLDNDVNWAAVAEQRLGAARDLSDFVFLYLGQGLGAGLVMNGTVARGAAGLAGEVSHVVTRGPGGRAMRLVECFRAWGLTQPESAAIDLDRLAHLWADRRAGRGIRTGVPIAVGIALASVTAMLNPAAVVIGGPWSGLPGLAEAIAAEFSDAAVVSAEIRSATVVEEAPLAGARAAAHDGALLALTG